MPRREQLDAIVGGGYAAGLLEFADCDWVGGGDAVLMYEGEEFGEVELRVGFGCTRPQPLS